jgi:hypothetical protein
MTPFTLAVLAVALERLFVVASALVAIVLGWSLLMRGAPWARREGDGASAPVRMPHSLGTVDFVGLRGPSAGASR